MDNPIRQYWQYRLNDVQKRLEANNFEVWTAASKQSAADIVNNDLLPALKPKSVSWGGSMTFIASGLYASLLARKDLDVIDTFDKHLGAKESYERRRRSLLVDLYFTGCNALTEAGQLVNLDMLGNRVAALTFGPRNLIVLIGRNKIVADIEGAMQRTKVLAAPANAIRLDKKTPCTNSAFCHDCSSPDRICNTWTISEKSYPKGRVKIILINEDLGL